MISPVKMRISPSVVGLRGANQNQSQPARKPGRAGAAGTGSGAGAEVRLLMVVSCARRSLLRVAGVPGLAVVDAVGEPRILQDRGEPVEVRVLLPGEEGAIGGELALEVGQVGPHFVGTIAPGQHRRGKDVVC